MSIFDIGLRPIQFYIRPSFFEKILRFSTNFINRLAYMYNGSKSSNPFGKEVVSL
jgi:hypothetical protein